MISLDLTNEKLELARLYTQFKQDKIKQFKEKSPSMANKRITKQIVKEWNTYTLEQQRNYPNKMGNIEMNLLPKPTPNKIANQNQILSTNSKKKGSNTSQEEVLINTFMKQEEVDKGMNKTKGIQKNTKTDYISFYKNHYSKYSREHPRWSSQQISVIIKLLWKNRQKGTTKKTSKLNFDVMKEARPKNMSAKMAFMRAGVNNTEKAWKKLPLESKKLWQSKQELLQNKDMNEEEIIRLPNPKMSLRFMNWK